MRETRVLVRKARCSRKILTAGAERECRSADSPVNSSTSCPASTSCRTASVSTQLRVCRTGGEIHQTVFPDSWYRRRVPRTFIGRVVNTIVQAVLFSARWHPTGITSGSLRHITHPHFFQVPVSPSPLVTPSGYPLAEGDPRRVTLTSLATV
jgi:hypothetical protein